MAQGSTVWICVCFAAVLQLVAGTPTAARPGSSRSCYQGFDCFTNDPPFNNAEGLLPQSPDTINTTFRLFTRTCPTRPVIVRLGQRTEMDACRFNSDHQTRVIVHGFLQHGQVSWIRNMAAALLVKGDMNVITVDWGSGSGFPYSQAAANTRVVGAEISRMIHFFTTVGVSPGNVHIIGHSLGAHVAGYAGDRVPHLGRITGLDPAEPNFKDTDLPVHLDKTDADFVDIIHSDGSDFDFVSGFGWIKDVGHIDFYPNGGENQPGCPTESVGNFMSAAYFHGLNDAEDVLSCSHSRSIYLFTESINSACSMLGHPCRDLAALDSNENSCLRCSSGTCPEMGFNAYRTEERGKFYLRTRGSSPFCGYTQHVEIEFSSMSPTQGHVIIEIVGHDQTMDSVTISSNPNQRFLSGGSYDILAIDRERIEDVEQVRVKFVGPTVTRWWWWSSSSSRVNFVSIYRVTVTSARFGRSIHFCGDHRQLTSGNTLTLSRSTTDPNECVFGPIVQHRIN